MWPYPKVIAHRGGGNLAPENTLAAMQCGLQHGFHAVEFDAMLSKDGIPVLMHDPELGRTVAGTVRVVDFTAQQLATMDAGTWFSPEFAGEPVPTLAQAAQFCKANRIWMNIEIKPVVGFEEQTGRAVGDLIRQLFVLEITAPGPIDPMLLPLFSSFSFDALMAAKAAAPHIPRGYLMDKITPDWREKLKELDAIALHTNHKNLTAEQAQAIKEAGYGLMCYTVNDPERAREIVGWGVDAFCTDRIDVIGGRFF